MEEREAESEEVATMEPEADKLESSPTSPGDDIMFSASKWNRKTSSVEEEDGAMPSLVC